jgi:hypothetical protein
LMRLSVPVLALLLAGLPVQGQEECACPKDFELLLSVLAEDIPPRMIACGQRDAEDGSAKRGIFEVSVIRCDTRGVVFGLDSMQRAVVEGRAGEIVVTEVQYLPFGRGWAWIDVPWFETRIRVSAPGEISRTETFVMKAPEIPQKEVRRVVMSVQLKAREVCDEALVGKLLTAALTGDPQARQTLARFDRHCRLDGHLGELYSEAVEIERIFFDPRHGVHVYKFD